MGVTVIQVSEWPLLQRTLVVQDHFRPNKGSLQATPPPPQARAIGGSTQPRKSSSSWPTASTLRVFGTLAFPVMALASAMMWCRAVRGPKAAERLSLMPFSSSIDARQRHATPTHAMSTRLLGQREYHWDDDWEVWGAERRQAKLAAKYAESPIPKTLPIEVWKVHLQREWAFQGHTCSEHRSDGVARALGSPVIDIRLVVQWAPPLSLLRSFILRCNEAHAL